MARKSELARTALMDAAEELFGRYGIDQVSSRRIAERAGNSNHSAVAYHFGDRDGLIRALFERQAESTDELRVAMFREIGPGGSLTDHLRCMILPATQSFSDLPVPSWRARFINQARHNPTAATLLAQRATTVSTASEEVRTLTIAHLGHLDRDVLIGRAWILSRMIFEVCAEYEAGIAAGNREADWAALGNFLTDAAAGLLAAPVTEPSPFRPTPDSMP
ncbi:TetR family transcriptional regulator [Rhodococcus sp. Q]|uniref:TetR/AcrR family transcriptional regulator n=1 Tax=Rhodococcus sp. Q TaxID=2502252 RepID=UPI0010F877C1|nr:TetR family transcriptional regulator [Rhodococcus sp. Q]